MTCVDHSSGVCGCGWLVGWVCMGACGGGGDGRKSMFSLVGLNCMQSHHEAIKNYNGVVVFLC